MVTIRILKFVNKNSSISLLALMLFATDAVAINLCSDSLKPDQTIVLITDSYLRAIAKLQISVQQSNRENNAALKEKLEKELLELSIEFKKDPNIRLKFLTLLKEELNQVNTEAKNMQPKQVEKIKLLEATETAVVRTNKIRNGYFLSDDGSRLYFHDDYTLTLFDLKTKQTVKVFDGMMAFDLHELDINGHELLIKHKPTDQALPIDRISIFNTANNSITKTYEGAAGSFIVLSNNKKHFVTMSQRDMKLYSVDTNKPIRTLELTDKSIPWLNYASPTKAFITKDNQHIAIYFNNHKIYVFDILTLKFIKKIDPPKEIANQDGHLIPQSMVANNDLSQIIYMNYFGEIYIKTKNQINDTYKTTKLEISDTHPDFHTSMTLIKNNTLLITYNSRFEIYNIHTKELIERSPLTGKLAEYKEPAISANGKTFSIQTMSTSHEALQTFELRNVEY